MHIFVCNDHSIANLGRLFNLKRIECKYNQKINQFTLSLKEWWWGWVVIFRKRWIVSVRNVILFPNLIIPIYLLAPSNWKTWSIMNFLYIFFNKILILRLSRLSFYWICFLVQCINHVNIIIWLFIIFLVIIHQPFWLIIRTFLVLINHLSISLFNILCTCRIFPTFTVISTLTSFIWARRFSITLPQLTWYSIIHKWLLRRWKLYLINR